MVDVVEATRQHADELALTMRPEDAIEIMSAHGGTPHEALHRALDWSVEAWTCLVDGNVLAMFGVTPGSLVGGTGNAWLLTSTLVEKHRKTFFDTYVKALAVLRSRWPHLRAHVHADYDRAVRCAARAGFVVHPVRRHEITNQPFRAVEIGGR